MSDVLASGAELEILLNWKDKKWRFGLPVGFVAVLDWAFIVPCDLVGVSSFAAFFADDHLSGSFSSEFFLG